MYFCCLAFFSLLTGPVLDLRQRTALLLEVDPFLLLLIPDRSLIGDRAALDLVRQKGGHHARHHHPRREEQGFGEALAPHEAPLQGIVGEAGGDPEHLRALVSDRLGGEELESGVARVVNSARRIDLPLVAIDLLEIDPRGA